MTQTERLASWDVSWGARRHAAELSAHQRIRVARELLDEGFYDDTLGYGYCTQAVNQAHRVLDGGEPPRETRA